MKVHALLLVLLLISGFALPAYSTSCEGELEGISRVRQWPKEAGSFMGVETDYFKVSRDRINYSELTDNPRSDLFVGFENGHSYFLWNGYRFDGGIVLGGLPIGLGRMTQSNVLTKGVVIKVPLTAGNIAELTKRVSKRAYKYNLTCAQGVCSQVKNSTGIGLSSNFLVSLVPTLVLRSILKNGVINGSKESIPLDVYLIGYKSLKSFGFQAGTQDAVLVTLYGFLNGLVATLPITFFLESFLR